MRVPSIIGFSKRLYELFDRKVRTLSERQTIEKINILGVHAEFKCVSPKEIARIRTMGGEPLFLEFFEREVKTGDCFYDIGANTGFYSVLAGLLVGSRGHVIAFEPETDNFSRLRTNARLNGLSNLLALPIALSDHDGLGHLQLYSPDVGEGAHAVVAQATASSMPVLLLTLDNAIRNYRLPKPTHVKIDVEGYEETVLDGMADTLASETLRAIALETHYFLNAGESRHYFSDRELEEKRERLLHKLKHYGFELRKEVVSSYEALRYAHQLFYRQ